MESVDYASFVSFAVSLPPSPSFPPSRSLAVGDQNDEASTPCSIGSLGMERERETEREREREREGEFGSLAETTRALRHLFNFKQS